MNAATYDSRMYLRNQLPQVVSSAAPPPAPPQGSPRAGDQCSAELYRRGRARARERGSAAGNERDTPFPHACASKRLFECRERRARVYFGVRLAHDPEKLTDFSDKIMRKIK